MSKPHPARVAAPVGRRTVLAAAAGGTGAALLPGGLGPAAAYAAPLTQAGAYGATPVPDRASRHLLNRFSYGITPAMYAEVRTAGGARAWFEQQLAPAQIPDSFANGLRSWWPHLSWTPSEIWRSDQSGPHLGWEILADWTRWSMLRRTYSRHQLLEVMTEFWSNHFHVTAPDGKSFPHRIGYDSTIRAYALGRFDQLLIAAITHPAMLCYLDAARSTAKNPNENLGREVLELHTIGRDGLFSEDDVRQSTMILTGWRVDMFNTWKAYYSQADHHVGPVRVMGFSAANASSDGRALTNSYLSYLAHHPATAHRIAKKLAVRFVSDTPSDALVGQLADVFVRSGTSIPATLRALIDSAEFKAAVRAKVRTPSEDVIATLRAMQVEVLEPTGRETDAAHAIMQLASAMSQTPFSWPRPDGFPDVNDAWSSASRILGSWRVHNNIAGGWYPSTAVRYQPVSHWLPRLPIRFDALVDHLCRTILARPSSPWLLDIASKAAGVGPAESITADHALVKWRMPQLLLSLLDTTHHMSR